MLKNIDTNDLSKINGGALPGPNGEGCTRPPSPFPRPNPLPNPIESILGGGTGIGTLGGLPKPR